MFDITSRSEELKTKVQYVRNLQCAFVDENVGFNYECVFFGNDQEIFYVYGDFLIQRTEKKEDQFRPNSEDFEQDPG